MGFFADNITVREQDVLDVAEASGIHVDASSSSVHSRLRKRRAIARNPDSRAAQLLQSGQALPEPFLEFDGPNDDRIITLRIRSLQKGVLLPVFAEGDVIVGVAKALKGKKKKRNSSSEDSDQDEDEGLSASEDEDNMSSSGSELDSDEGGLLLGGQRKEEKLKRTRTHTSIFRVCSVYWGTRAYVKVMTAEGNSPSATDAMAAGRATAGQNCFAVCRLLKAG